jgi:hypothetical protein
LVLQHQDFEGPLVAALDPLDQELVDFSFVYL